MDNRAIGVFDSGLGGLTAVRRLHKIMPSEKIIYFGDTGRVPYGTRGRDTIIKYTRQDIRFLMQHALKAILVACGTVSSVALSTVAQEFDVPIFGVVEPACEKALRVTRSGRIGVIGTPGTIRSGAYERVLNAARDDLHLVARACPLFVPLVENGRVQRGDVVIETVVREYLQPMRDAGIDTLILGCTHYPLLKTVIGDFVGEDVTLIDPGASAADALKLSVEPAEGPGETHYYVSDDTDSFDALAELFLKEKLEYGAQLVEIAAY